MLTYGLFTEFTTCAFVEFATETLFDEIVETVAKGFETHVVDDLVDEGVLQQELGLVERNTSLTHVEEGRIVELANGRAVGTFHIIGIDLEHGLGVHTGLTGGRQVLVGHLRGGLLGPMLHEHTTSKGTCGLIVEHVFVEFVRGAMRCLMGNERVVVDVLLLIGYHTAIALALGTLAREREVEFVAGDTIVQGDDIVVDTAVGLLVDIDIAHAYILIMGLLETLEIE